MTNYQAATAVGNTVIWTFWLRYVLMYTDVFLSVAFAIATAGVGFGDVTIGSPQLFL